MGVITAYKARKYINSLSSYHDLKHPDALKAANCIKEIGSASIPHLIESLNRNKAHGVVYEILMGFISNETLPLFVKTLSNCNAKISAEIVNLLSAATSYDPNYILEVFTDRSDTQAALIKILDRHKDRLSAQSIKNLLAKMDKENRTSILRLLEKITTDHTVSELLPWTQNDEWVTRLGMARILGRFRSHQVETTLLDFRSDLRSIPSSFDRI